MRGDHKDLPVPEHQADATLIQAPVSGTKYTVLDTTLNVRIIEVIIQCTWTVQPSPLEAHITIDGQDLTFTKTNPVTATSYYVGKIESIAAPGGTLDTLNRRALLLEGRSVKIEAEITGGTVSELRVRVKYAKW